ncbi:EamA family transporter [Nocardioides marinus]|uniref:Putative blue pigment (Indigoidine) exporter n=1 Tax=Nocardioides marinus TaxID=374514 RepID=A0A7Z0C485_9ACTN|nr:EamA family transporter [Nocardioides marinus]NYI09849.1 putative blue pigment (indigoidine) exporter [Nocardioides marinus]
MTTTPTQPHAAATPQPARSASPPGRAGMTLAAAVAPAVWGTTYIVTTHLLPPDHPLFAALVRALPAGVLGLLIARRLPRGAWWWKAAVLGTLNIGLFFPLLFVAAERLPGGVAATLGATQPILVAFLAVIVLSERLSRWRLAWGVVGLLGVGMVVLGPGAVLDPIGVIAGISGAAAMGTGVVLTKRWGRPTDVSAVGYAGWQLTAGGLVLLAPALLIDGVPGRLDAPGVAGYLWLGVIGGLVAYTLWFTGIRNLPVTATALLGLLSPLVAAALGVLVAGETLNPIQLVGFGLALAALAAGQLTGRPRTRKERIA